MGKNIGTLGREHPPLDLEFTYFDKTIRVHPHATDEVEVEFVEAGRDIDLAELEGVDFDTVEAMTDADRVKLIRTMSRAQQAGYHALMDALHRLIHPDDFQSYWDTGKEHGQQVRDRMADIRAITAAVTEAVTDFPTGRRSGSPPGPAPTPASSGAGSSSPDIGHPTDLQVALALERGRPDIQEFYVMQAEQEEAEKRQRREADQRDQRKLAEAGLN
jgi:hypothetical protein